MPENETRLTVYFDPPFWVGVYERVSGGTLEAAKITFGAEPKDYEVYDYLLTNWSRLCFSPAVKADLTPSYSANPKRRQRAIRSELLRQGSSTKSQQALALQRAAKKASQQTYSKQAKEEEKTRRFALRQEKRKKKRRGH